MRYRISLLCISIFTAICAANANPDQSNKVTTAKNAGSTLQSVSLTHQRPSCNTHQTHTYNFKYQDTSSTPARLFGTGALAANTGTTQNIDVVIQLLGSLKVTCLNQDRAVEAYEFSDLKLSQKGLENAQGSTANRLTAFIIPEQNPTILFDQPIQPILRNTLRSVLQLQYFTPKSSVQWDYDAIDIHGSFFAEIKAHKSGDAKRYVESKRYYQPGIPGAMVPDVSVLPHSKIEYLFEDQKMDSMHANLSFEFFLNQSPAGNRNVNFSVSRLSSAPNSKKAIDSLLGTFQSALAQPAWKDDFGGVAYHEYLDRQMQRQELGSLSWQAVENLVMTANQENMTQAFLKLKAYLILHPSSADKVTDLLVTLNSQDSRFGLMALALAEAGTEASQLALVDGLQRLQEPTDKVGLLRHAGLAKQPGIALEEAFKEISQSNQNTEVKQTANLALSNVALTVKSSEPSRYRDLLKSAKIRLDQAKDYASTVNALNELGNYGTHEALGWAEQYQKHPAPGIRATALETLRFVEGQQAEQLLLERLNKDPNDLVRNTAAQELNYRRLSKSGLNEVKQLLNNKPNERVKTLLLTTLAHHATQDNEIRAKLKYYRDNDPSKEVRLHAKSLLTSLE